MSALKALVGARIFDAVRWHDHAALLIEDGMVRGIVPIAGLPDNTDTIALDGGMLVPGFIDLQVNGGGGALFNESPTVDAITTMCATFARFGTSALLPTLITDTREVTAAAVAAGAEAARRNVPGFLGLHLEGPHLSVARKGAHDPNLIRPMDEADLSALAAARTSLPNLLTTVAAETVTPDQVARLRRAGLVVSIGHSEAPYALARAAAEAGATMATHLFNAMSQLGNREPGVVGAALDTGTMFAGLIADGIHVHPAAIAIALRAKAGPGRIFLVTDAMPLTGSDAESFVLNGRAVYRAGGALRLADGTLAGADLTLVDAVAFMHRKIGLALDEALRMASLYPAQAMGIDRTHGHLGQGARADFVHLSEGLAVNSTWIGGSRVHQA